MKTLETLPEHCFTVHIKPTTFGDHVAKGLVEFFKIFTPAMGISKEAQVEDVDVEIDDDDEADDTITPVSGSPGKLQLPKLIYWFLSLGEGVKETIDGNSIKLEFDDPRDKTRETKIGGRKSNVVNDEL